VHAGAGLPIRDEELSAVLDELVGVLRHGLAPG